MDNYTESTEYNSYTCGHAGQVGLGLEPSPQAAFRELYNLWYCRLDHCGPFV